MDSERITDMDIEMQAARKQIAELDAQIGELVAITRLLHQRVKHLESQVKSLGHREETISPVLGMLG